MKKNKILVTGGSGMVGNSLKLILPEAIYISSKEYNLTSEIDVIKMYKEINPECVIHLAARVGGIVDNINKPYTYFNDNILMNTLLVEHARKNNVKRFIGILSTCIYPDVVENYPMKEENLHDGPPTPTNFSYGYAKRCMAVQIDAYNKQYGTNYQYLTPCNLYGHFDNYENENKMHFVSALIKKIHLAKINGDDKIVLFGTGNPLRQFMHSDDLAYVIKYCLDNNIYENFNVATEENFSINEIAKIALRACGAEHINIQYDSSKPDGQFRKDVSIEKLKKYIPHFSPIDLCSGIKKTYDYILTNNIFDTKLNLKSE
jgi:GDP-L-fucose synthase